MSELTYPTVAELAYKSATESLTEQQFKEWRSCYANFRTYAHFNRIFVLWDLVDKVSVVLGAVRVLEPSISRDAGINFKLSVETKEYLNEITVSHSPTPIYEGKVFAFIPSEIAGYFSPNDRTGRNTLKVSMHFNTQARPWDEAPGVRMPPLGEFRAKFPEYKNLVL